MQQPHPAYLQAYDLMQLENPDTTQVFELLQKAYAEGSREATYAIGTWYFFGSYDLPTDQKKGFKLFKEAAEQNYPNALYDLAVCYEKGIPCKKNRKKAFACYLKAAIRGEVQSMEEVGRCYYYGIGVRKNKTLAHIWYDRFEEMQNG